MLLFNFHGYEGSFSLFVQIPYGVRLKGTMVEDWALFRPPQEEVQAAAVSFKSRLRITSNIRTDLSGLLDAKHEVTTTPCCNL